MQESNNVTNAKNKQQEGFGYAKPIKPVITAWAVEIDGEVHPQDVVKTRRLARQERKELQDIFPNAKVHVRRVQIVPVKGR